MRRDLKGEPIRLRLDSGFPGVCPFHRDCLEALASGPAILARTVSSLQRLDLTHPQWDIEPDYLGQCARRRCRLYRRKELSGTAASWLSCAYCGNGPSAFGLDRHQLASRSGNLFDGPISATQFARDLLCREHHQAHGFLVRERTRGLHIRNGQGGGDAAGLSYGRG